APAEPGSDKETAGAEGVSGPAVGRPSGGDEAPARRVGFLGTARGEVTAVGQAREPEATRGWAATAGKGATAGEGPAPDGPESDGPESEPTGPISASTTSVEPGATRAELSGAEAAAPIEPVVTAETSVNEDEPGDAGPAKG
ncbi:hypothetical protein, partial [Actinophytocola sp.]|uniref:hypothetical protein n=1 Tax=Actinophytocola sp. TaxID=1872138 RepID=UPI002ED95674